MVLAKLNQAQKQASINEKKSRTESKYKLEAKDVLPNKLHTGRQKGQKCHFLSLLTLTFKLAQARDQTCLPCKFGANPFSGLQYHTQTKKPQTDGAENRTLCSSLNVIIIRLHEIK